MELVTVDFKSNKLEVIEESQSIVIKDICNNMGLKFDTQHKKIKADPTYQSKLIKVQTAGGMQEVFTIPLSKFNGWLFSINPNKVKPEVKDRLIEYKNECFDVLYNHFNKPKPIKDDKIEKLEHMIYNMSNTLEKIEKNIRPQNENIIVNSEKVQDLDNAKTHFQISKRNKNDNLKNKEKFYQDILKVIANHPNGASQRTLLKEAGYSQSKKIRRWLQEQISILWDMTIIPGKCYKYVLKDNK
ncbi:MAG: phage antirepressor N-terminal domain-containing protein [Campylobacterota bacterium]|nr:phage antirepressor N-terminal domain-containing protein [Campylobacterota bacterium]